VTSTLSSRNVDTTHLASGNYFPVFCGEGMSGVLNLGGLSPHYSNERSNAVSHHAAGPNVSPWRGHAYELVFF
jgi:hypothetical protein